MRDGISTPTTEPAGWLDLPGELARRIRERDWARTPLGPIDEWPQSLRSAVQTMLANPMVSSLAVGQELIFLFNDTAAPLYGALAETALGRPLLEAFHEGGEAVAPYYERARAGESVTVRAMPLDTRGEGRKTELFDAFLTPVRDETGAVSAVLMTGFAAAANTAEAETALRQSEAKYRSVFESINEGFAIMETVRDDAGRLVDLIYRDVNPLFERLTGLQALPGTTVRQIIPNIDEDWFAYYHQASKSGEPSVREEFNGDTGRWYRANTSRIGGDGSRLLAVAFEDISERKRSEATLRKSEERQAFLLKLSDALRPLTNVKTIQDRAMHLLGRQLNVDRAFYYVAERDAAGWVHVVTTDYHRRPDMVSLVGRYPEATLGPAFFARLAQGDTLIIPDIEHLDGLTAEEIAGYQSIQVGSHIAVPLMKDGAYVAGVCASHATARSWTKDEVALVVDVAERTWAAVERGRAEEALRGSEARLAAAFESVPAGLAVVDLNGRAVIANAEFRRFLPTGVIPSRDPDRGNRWQGWSDDGRLLDPQDWPSARALRGESVIPGQEMQFTDDDGRKIWTNVATAPTFDEAGKVTGVVSVISDIDVRKRSEEALQKSERHAQILLAELQHRVRNTLAVVRSIARRTAESSTSAEDMLAHFQGRFDAFSRVQAALTRSTDQKVDLRSLIDDELVAHATREGGQVHISGPPIALESKAAERLSLAIHELTTNAVKHGALRNDQGRVRISWAQKPNGGVPELQLNWNESGVEDVAPSDRQGFGMELLTRSLPYDVQGTAEVELAPGGLRFELRMPLPSNSG